MNAMNRHSAATVDATVRTYYATVCDPASTADDLRRLLAADLTVIEHPNVLSPRGAVRDLAQTLAGFDAGRALLSEQDFDVHEVIATADRAAVRATWSGTLKADAGPLHAGRRLVAHVASLLTVRDGLIAHQETFDCYEPIT